MRLLYFCKKLSYLKIQISANLINVNWSVSNSSRLSVIVEVIAKVILAFHHYTTANNSLSKLFSWPTLTFILPTRFAFWKCLVQLLKPFISEYDVNYRLSYTYHWHVSALLNNGAACLKYFTNTFVMKVGRSKKYFAVTIAFVKIHHHFLQF